MIKRLTAIRILASLAALAYWLMLICLIYRSYFYLDPPNSNLTGSDRYGHNGAGDFETFAIISAIEFAIVYLIVRPHSFNLNSWRRPLVALVPLVPWTFLNLSGVLHSSNVYMLHLLWLLALNMLLSVVALATFVAWLISRRKNFSNSLSKTNLS